MVKIFLYFETKLPRMGCISILIVFRRHQAVSFTNLGCASVRAIVRSPLVAHENAQTRIK